MLLHCLENDIKRVLHLGACGLEGSAILLDCFPHDRCRVLHLGTCVLERRSEAQGLRRVPGCTTFSRNWKDERTARRTKNDLVQHGTLAAPAIAPGCRERKEQQGPRRPSVGRERGAPLASAPFPGTIPNSPGKKRRARTAPSVGSRLTRSRRCDRYLTQVRW